MRRGGHKQIQGMKKLNAEKLPDSAERRGNGVRESELLHHETTGAIIGALYAVHSELGPGLLEALYKKALTVLLRKAGFDVRREVPYEVFFHGNMIGFYRADLVVDSKVIVEVKAGRLIDPAHIAQLSTYLRASRITVGLLLNFGPRAEFKRMIATSHSAPAITEP